MKTIKQHLRATLRRVSNPRGKSAFLDKLGSRAAVLDVGCGNDSPYHTKTLAPDCIYTGLDIGECNQTKPNLADYYILARPQDFAAEIGKHAHQFDAVISSHNFEHCNDRDQTLVAMLGALKPGGRLYMSFPCAQSVSFPRRQYGCLNYFDDPTHTGAPPDFEQVLRTVSSSGCIIEYAAARYRPFVQAAFGWLNEGRSAREGRVLKGTWAYYGFESVIWARRRSEPK